MPAPQAPQPPQGPANSALGMVKVTNQAQLQAHDIKIAAEVSKNQDGSTVFSELVGHFNGRWEVAKQAKMNVVDRLNDCLRRRRGMYSPEKLAEISAMGGSAVYMQLTGIKCRAAEAWISEMELPDGERSWGIEPTSIPDNGEDLEKVARSKLEQQVAQAEQQAQQGAAQAQQAGQPAPPVPPAPDATQLAEMLNKIHLQLVNEVEEQMQTDIKLAEDVLADQQDEGHWTEALQEALTDYVTFPACIVRGNIPRRQRELEWQTDEKGARKAVVVEKTKYGWARVSPYDLFPAPESKDIDDSWLIERHRWSVSDLSSLIGVKGYDEAAIRMVIANHNSNQDVPMLAGDAERRRIEGESQTVALERTTIEVLELWDNILGRVLIQWDAGRKLIGKTEIDPEKTYAVNVLMCGNKVISAVLNDDLLGRKPYGKSCYVNVPGSFWGLALPETMSDLQDVCNATARSLVNNVAIASGPQVRVYTDLLPPGTQVTALFPWKIWQLNSARAGGADPVSFFQPHSNAQELMSIFEKFSQLADEYTGIPSYTYGDSRQGGAGNTASGLSMLFGAASKGIKQAVRHFDRGIVARLVGMQYEMNLMQGTDGVMGDAQVVARGSGAVIAKEQLQIRRKELLQIVSNPTDMQIIGIKGRAKMLGDIFDDAGLHDIVPDPDTAEAQYQQAQQQALQLAEAQAIAAINQKAAERQQATGQAQQFVDQVAAAGGPGHQPAAAAQHQAALHPPAGPATNADGSTAGGVDANLFPQQGGH